MKTVEQKQLNQEKVDPMWFLLTTNPSKTKLPKYFWESENQYPDCTSPWKNIT